VPDTWEGHKLSELLGTLKHCYPVALSRAGKSSLPEKDTVLQAGDLLNVSSTLEGIGELTRQIAQKAEA
jgi:Trk K+ transport system NAD-binding subunit